MLQKIVAKCILGQVHITLHVNARVHLKAKSSVSNTDCLVVPISKILSGKTLEHGKKCHDRFIFLNEWHWIKSRANVSTCLNSHCELLYRDKLMLAHEASKNSRSLGFAESPETSSLRRSLC